MMDFQIKKTGRRCFATDRELVAGEPFYSDLVQSGQDIERRDYCEEAWTGPGEGSLGWWRARIPKRDGDRVYWAPRDVLFAYFESLQQNDAHQATAYVMALLMIRKRMVQLVDTHEEDGKEWLEVQFKKENKTWNVTVVELDAAAIQQIQLELAEQLFMDHPPEAS